MHNSRKLSIFSMLSRLVKVSFYTALTLFLVNQTLYAQQNFRTPVINGVINAQQLEYGNNEEDHDRRTSGNVIWWITWDENNFYVANETSMVTDGAVCYFDRNPIAPTNSGGNNDGTLAGFNFDNARYGTLPFRADFVSYFSTVKREWHSSDLAGGWGPAVLGGGNFASVGSQREYGIPWNAITNGNGRPTSFLFLCHAVSSGGFVYGQIPLQNPGGNIGLNATATHFYRVYDSIDPVNKPPFAIINTPGTPTSAFGNISGSVTTKTGRAIPGAQVTLVGGDGIFRSAITNPFGYYVLNDVPVGEFYVLSIGGSKKVPGYADSRAFMFNDSLTDVNFIIQQ